MHWYVGTMLEASDGPFWVRYFWQDWPPVFTQTRSVHSLTCMRIFSMI